MEQYRDFAFVYDELMNEVDYNGWVKYIEDIINMLNNGVVSHKHYNIFLILSPLN